MKKKKGFTLVELLVVISIIALLLSILIPSLGKARELARRSVCGSQMKQLGIGVTSYAMKNDGKLLNTIEPTRDSRGNPIEEAHPFVAYRIDRFYPNNNDMLWPYRFACLYENRVIQDAKVFYCPSNKDEERSYKSYVDPEPWGSLPQNYNTIYATENQWVRVGYEYFPVERYFKRDPFTGVPEYLATKFDRLDPLLPYMTDVLRTKATMSHRSSGVCGVNAVYPDGSVIFCNDQDVFSDKLLMPRGASLSGRLWDANPSKQTKTVIFAIYYARFLAISDPFHHSLNRAR